MRARGALRIAWVAPPFAGHLFPQLSLARELAARGFTDQTVHTTDGAAGSVAAAGVRHAPLLPGRGCEVLQIANTDKPVTGSPRAMLRQLRANLALCTELRRELARAWEEARPDVVIADFTLPVAGHLAEGLGVPWWTTTPSPCAIETRTGTPAYLGGWRDHGAWWSRLRDRLGNQAVHTCKRWLARAVRSELAALGVEDIHRADGTEVVYSAALILALGAREFELPRRDWPRALEFIGPVFAPVRQDRSDAGPAFEPGRTHVLVSLGTHLFWAKDAGLQVAAGIARARADWSVHYTLGRAGLGEARPELSALELPANLTVLDFVPYDARLGRYDLALVHGGTGVTYACLAAGVPLAVWPQDYDQFDHAVRIERLGVGRRVRKGAEVEATLECAWDEGLRAAARRFQTTLAAYDPCSALERHLVSLCDSLPARS